VAGIGALTAVTVLAVAGIVLAARGSAGGQPLAATPAIKLAALASLGNLGSPGPPGPLGPEGVPVPAAPDLAPAVAPAQPVGHIQCLANEQLAFHIHVHLTIFDHGAARRVPGGVGIEAPQTTDTPQGPYVAGGGCFYWLHTHAADGIVHIESPIVQTYTLGDFFDVWGQKLGPDQVGPAVGPVTAIYNGRLFDGNPRQIPLTAHAQVQLEVGRPLTVPDSIAFPSGL
jgi:hypothetical protein